jgi:TatA/E family protein of Tat protein translocase
MFDIGLQELIVVFVLALLVFGPKNLPQLGRALGRAMREFRRASDEFRSTIETNLQINETEARPSPAPVTSDEVVGQMPPPAEALADSVLDPHAVPAAAGEPAPPPPGEAYVARRGARLFHTRECTWVAGITETERVYFKKVAEAREAGHVNCPACDPWEPA